jgi:agmatinase
MVTARDIDKIGTQGIIDKIKERVVDSKVYISVDIDVLDPAFAPGSHSFVTNLSISD